MIDVERLTSRLTGAIHPATGSTIPLQLGVDRVVGAKRLPPIVISMIQPNRQAMPRRCNISNHCAPSPTLCDNLEARLGDPALYGLHNKMFLFDLSGRKLVHAGSLNGTETSNKVNREVALQVESGAAYDYLHNMFEYDWAFQPRVYLPLLPQNYASPPNLLISKVFYLADQCRDGK
jgi:hypothetical protein